MNRQELWKMIDERFRSSNACVLRQRDELRDKLENTPYPELERFAALVAAHEREACAKVCDGWPDYDVQGLAEAIRARGRE